MSNSSAYELIKANIGEDGKLPHTFSLEEKPALNQMGFMPGAMDGIGVFHMSGGSEKKTIKEIAALLKKHFKTGDGKYISKIEKILSDGRTISLIDPLLQHFRDNHRGIDPNKVVQLSLNIAKASGNIELIKIGIGLLGLFDLGEYEEITETITTLALYDDFTLFAVVAASGWTNGNALIFKVARHVTGWGKIHAVERLEPENQEMRDWILRDGCANGIMDAYLGLTCAVKGDLISALRQDNLYSKLFDSVAVIIDALLDEGPAPGISEYEHAEEALNLYLRHAKQHSDKTEHLWRILNLRDWAESAETNYKKEAYRLVPSAFNKRKV